MHQILHHFARFQKIRFPTQVATSKLFYGGPEWFRMEFMVRTIPRAVDFKEMAMVQNLGAKKHIAKNITYVFLFAAE